MIEIREPGKVPLKLWVGTRRGQALPGMMPKWEIEPDIEDSAMKQLTHLSNLPVILPEGIAVMPDVHWGNGASVGSVIPTIKAVIPSAVGVDIGCGMMAVRLDGVNANHLSEKLLHQIHSEIVHTVPTGFARHTPGTQNERAVSRLWEKGKWVFGKYPEMMRKRKDAPDILMGSQFGSLGGGNHFIELCLDENNEVWVMLHSGSRGIGNTIGVYFISRAKELSEALYRGRYDPHLGWFDEGSELFVDYVKAVSWAQDYAMQNREDMMRRILLVMQRHFPPFRTRTEAINCHHNYVEQETHYGESVWLTRKGAIRAGKGELGIIPGSMGAKSFIVRGKGSPASYETCSHGAGRVMSRSRAEKELTVESLQAAMKGIVGIADARVLDEHPAAYKDIDAVMGHQTDLVDIVHTLRQVLNVKGTN